MRGAAPDDVSPDPRGKERVMVMAFDPAARASIDALTVANSAAGSSWEMSTKTGGAVYSAGLGSKGCDMARPLPSMRNP